MTRVVVEFEWRLIGPIGLDADRRPMFPALPDTPGLYRFWFEQADGPGGVYIGETDRLRRRAQHYRTPGSGQQTNLRLNAQLVEALGRGVRVTFWIITGARLSLDETPRPLDLERKSNRMIVENAALAAQIAEHEREPQRAPIPLNRPGVGEAEWS